MWLSAVCVLAGNSHYILGPRSVPIAAKICAIHCHRARCWRDHFALTHWHLLPLLCSSPIRLRTAANKIQCHDGGGLPRVPGKMRVFANAASESGVTDGSLDYVLPYWQELNGDFFLPPAKRFRLSLHAGAGLVGTTKRAEHRAKRVPPLN